MKLSALAPVVIAAALALSACSPAPAPAAYVPATLNVPAAPAAVAPAPAVRCEEDAPCWNCHTMGNKTCNITTAATAREAWATFDTYTFAPAVVAHAAYVSTLDHEPAHLPMTEFTLQSVAHPNEWHIFRQS